MTKVGDQYRQQAALERRFALEATLPNVKAIHEAAEQKWIEMAERVERHADPK